MRCAEATVRLLARLRKKLTGTALLPPNLKILPVLHRPPPVTLSFTSLPWLCRLPPITKVQSAPYGSPPPIPAVPLALCVFEAPHRPALVILSSPIWPDLASRHRRYLVVKVVHNGRLLGTLRVVVCMRHALRGLWVHRCSMLHGEGVAHVVEELPRSCGYAHVVRRPALMVALVHARPAAEQ